MKLLIVDDEIQIRTGLAQGIDWQEIGIHEVITAQNGVEALEICHLQHPEIVITDIRMPGIDGLELSRQICALYRPVKIIIVSGYSEFEYAKEAIKIGALDYLLKPINIDELIEKVKLAKKAIQTEIEMGKYEQESFATHYKKQIQQYTKNGTYEGTNEDLVILFRNYTGLSFDNHLFLGCVGLDTYSHQNRDQILIYVNTNLRGILEGFKGTVLFEDEEKIFFLIQAFSSHERALKLTKLREQIGRLIAILVNQYQITASIVVSRMGNLKQITELYEECLDGIRHRLYLGRACFVDCELLKKGTQVTYISSNSGLIQEQIRRFSCEGAIESIRKELDQLKVQQIVSEHQVREICLQQKNILLDTLMERGIDVESIFEYNTSLLSEIPRYFTIDEYLEWISNLYDLILKGMARWEGTQHSRITIKAMDYISQNYNKDIRLEQVACYVDKSKNYFSALFKKEVGSSFVEYLNQVRIDQSMHLLRTTEKLTYEISEEVGYSDYKHFFSVFKKLTGISPAQYRKEQSNDYNGKSK